MTSSPEPADTTAAAGSRCPRGLHTRRRDAKSTWRCRPCATGATERAAALVASALPELGQDSAVEFVALIATSNPRLDPLIAHLQARPDALSCGDSDCPRVVLDLVNVLVDAGARGAVRLRCARCDRPNRHLQAAGDGGRLCETCRMKGTAEPCSSCGRTAPVHRRPAGEVLCYRCSARDPRWGQPCSRCGTHGAVVTRIQGEVIGACCYVRPIIRCTVCGVAKGLHPWKTRRPVCASCQQRESVPCSRCSRDAAATTGDDPAVCAVCRVVPAEPCRSCGIPTPGRDRNGTVRCHDCYQRPVRRCGRCGRTRAIARLAVGDDPELCALCWTGPTVACENCGQIRPCRGERRGRMLCSACAPVAPQRCSHCGHDKRVTAHWHEGPVCAACYQRALAAKATCPGCNQHRRLMIYPGREQPVCSTCAGAPAHAVCSRCGTEDALYKRGLCPSCSLRDHLAAVLGDADQRQRRGTQPVVDHLLALERPRWVLDWLNRTGPAVGLLAELATGRDPLTYDDIDALPSTQSTWLVERLLVATGVLAARDPVLARMERWTSDYLDTITDSQRRRILTRYAAWHVLRPLRKKSEQRDLVGTEHNSRKTDLKIAATFLEWLDTQQRGLGDCTQTVIDRWLAGGPESRRRIGPFLTWAGEQGLAGDFELPRRAAAASASLVGTDERWALARRLLHAPGVDLTVRVAGLLVVLYGVPVTRISRLTVADVERRADTVQLHIGSSPLFLQPPFDAHVLALRERYRSRTVTQLGRERSDWLFPGRTPTQPVNNDSLAKRLREHGIHPASHRPSALAHLAVQTPVAILADLLDISPGTAAKWSDRGSGTWTDYLARRDKGASSSGIGVRSSGWQ